MRASGAVVVGCSGGGAGRSEGDAVPRTALGSPVADAHPTRENSDLPHRPGASNRIGVTGVTPIMGQIVLDYPARAFHGGGRN